MWFLYKNINKKKTGMHLGPRSGFPRFQIFVFGHNTMSQLSIGGLIDNLILMSVALHFASQILEQDLYVCNWHLFLFIICIKKKKGSFFFFFFFLNKTKKNKNKKKKTRVLQIEHLYYNCNLHFPTILLFFPTIGL